jgi:hypothetical protein
VGGALPVAELVELLEEVGFTDIRMGERSPCFAGTSAETKVSKDLEIGGLEVFARRPA